VVDGVIWWASDIGGDRFSESIPWIRSRAEFITSECISQREESKSIVFENGSTLKQIAPEGFPGQV
jgi:hypothetical protein